MGDDERFRLAYVAYTFPVLTQTFTTREVLALRDLGLDVRVFAAKRDVDADLDEESGRARRVTTYLPDGLSVAALLAALRWALRRPVRLLGVLRDCLGGGYQDRPVWSRVRSVRHFLCGTALAEALRRTGPWHRVHAQFVDAGSTVAFVAARLLDLPFSFTNHTAYNPFLLRPKARHADVILSISEFDRRRVLAAAPEAAGKVHVCRVGIRVEEWHGLERRPERGRLLCVAALREKKGQDDLIRASALLRDRGVATRVVLAGDGPERGRLEALAGELGVAVEFLGAVSPERVREELSRAQLFVLPCKVARNGDLDGIPVALMEAMAAGVPVVSTRLSGIPELIEDGVNGWLAEPGDARSLADVLAAARAERSPESPRLAPAHHQSGAARCVRSVLTADYAERSPR